LLLCWYLLFIHPELRPNRITRVEIKNKSLKELRLTEPLPITDKKDEIYSPAGIAANPMLYAVLF
jgi:hypothetical protein